MRKMTEDSLRRRINLYVRERLDHFESIFVKKPKAIHDSVHGTNIFYPHETAFLDLPIVQRLRRISQTDVASYVYPAGNHNRFEHSIGVAIVAGRMVDSLFMKENPLLEQRSCDHHYKTYIYNHCRIAAILHDCGHGPFSHLSEEVYKDQLSEIKKENPELRGASAHEILSYYIVKSDALRAFNKNIIEKQYHVKIDLDFVASMIVGYIDKERRKDDGFAVEIINGAFDADKLDYTLRDAHSTGILMSLDVPRLLYTLSAVKYHGDGISRLAIDISGVAALEELIFNKMMLNSTIYSHQKVRAAGCLLKSILNLEMKDRDATDYLKYTDDHIFSLQSENSLVNEYLEMLRNRALPKRAFCFSPRTLKDVSKLKTIMTYLENNTYAEEIIEAISNDTERADGTKVGKEYIWLDSPSTPKYKEATQCLIKSEGAPHDVLTLRDVFPVDDWVKAFSESKWQGFVFARPQDCEIVAQASKRVFEELFDTGFNDFAFRLCKIEP
jgi:HD superfamily phosphohydrolase